MRAFVALPLGAELGERVGAEVERALGGAAAPRHYRLARRDGLHLTLFFLGEVAGEFLARLAGELGPTIAGLAAPALVLAESGGFPSAERARVLWLGLRERDGAGRLAVLRQAVLAGLDACGVDTERERREPFRPHVTVARLRGRPAPLPGEFSLLRLEERWDPSAVVLFESRAEPGGSRYVERASLPFSSPFSGADRKPR